MKLLFYDRKNVFGYKAFRAELSNNYFPATETGPLLSGSGKGLFH